MKSEKSEKDIHIPFNSPLRVEDTESSTYGCRHSNPDICGANRLFDICAFARDDAMCLKPSASWKKQYHKLKEQQG